LCEEANIAQRVALETNESIIAGNTTKPQAWISSSNTARSSRGYPEQVADAYLGLGVKHFHEEVASGRLPILSTTVCG